MNDSVKNLNVEVSGSGTPVVMVHGLGGSTNVWEPQVRALDGKYQFVRFDLPGSGRSPASGKLSIDGWVETLAALADSLKLSRFVLAAHSLGTLISQHFAARFPERVSHLALFGINRAPADARRQTVRDRAAKVRSTGMKSIVDSVIDGGLSSSTKTGKLEVVAFVREVLLAQSDEGYARSCEAVADAQPADLSKITCPVLLVAGTDDIVSPPAISESVASELKNARVEKLEGCGHWIPVERATEVTRLLERFPTA